MWLNKFLLSRFIGEDSIGDVNSKFKSSVLKCKKKVFNLLVIQSVFIKWPREKSLNPIIRTILKLWLILKHISVFSSKRTVELFVFRACFWMNNGHTMLLAASCTLASTCQTLFFYNFSIMRFKNCISITFRFIKTKLNMQILKFN